MFAMVLITFVVMCFTAVARVNSVRHKEVSPKYYKLMSGSEAPEHVVKTGRHFSNLFEVPVLFYVAGVLCITLGIESAFFIVTAWLFVLFRICHAVIHITYNNPLHRLFIFLFGNICVLSLWVGIIVKS